MEIDCNNPVGACWETFKKIKYCKICSIKCNYINCPSHSHPLHPHLPWCGSRSPRLKEELAVKGLAAAL